MCCDKDTRFQRGREKNPGGLPEEGSIIPSLEVLGGGAVRSKIGCSVGFEFQINNK